jgi:hypothetical protein
MLLGSYVGTQYEDTKEKVVSKIGPSWFEATWGAMRDDFIRQFAPATGFGIIIFHNISKRCRIFNIKFKPS